MSVEPSKTAVEAGKTVSLLGWRALFPRSVGATPATSADLGDFRHGQLLLAQLAQPGQAHVYRAECRAGERLRVQAWTPLLARGAMVTPAVAVVAQGMPNAAAVPSAVGAPSVMPSVMLPVKLPAGYGVVAQMPPKTLLDPVTDRATGARFFAGPTIDTRTLVGGRCYIVVWSPTHGLGKYGLRVGSRPRARWQGWLGWPRLWWQVRGWCGLSRWSAYGFLAALLLLGWLLRRARRRA